MPLEKFGILIMNTLIKYKVFILYNLFTTLCLCWFSYLQSRNGDTDVENKHMDTKEGKEGWDKLGDWDEHTHTHTQCIQ